MSQRTTQEKALRKLDDRLKIAGVARSALGKVFPDHWSFMLGEIALYSFMILVATGVYLTLFFEPSTAERVYTGSYAPLRGELLSSAYASTVSLSWDVRGGLLMRQAHHWSAHIFIGAILLHLCRIFFTGMFRKPREINWLVGLTLLVLAIVNAFFGYSLPDDLLSGTGLHIFWSVALSVPVVGPWLAFLIFDGDFPGELIIERLYTWHILVIPALIALLIAIHLGVLIRQKHSHFSGPGRSNANVVGSRMWPTYALRSMALLAAVASLTFFMGGFAQINPIWVWGDYETATILEPSVADWYIAWVEGGLRLFPPVEFTIGGYLVPNQFFAGVLLPALTFVLLYLWPWLDRRITGDRGTHHVTGRPRDCPVRTAIGIAALTFYFILLVAGAQELISQWTAWPVGTIRAVLRGLVLGLPVLTGAAAYFIARSLKRSERSSLLELSSHDIALPPTREEKMGPPQPEERELSEVPSWISRDGERAHEERVGPPQPEERELSEVPSWIRRRREDGGE